MKTLIIGLFFLSLTNLTTAQNANYLKTISSKKNAKQIVQLQKKAANFNIKDLESYEKNAEVTYNVTFENPNGKIIATYNKSGIILKTTEEYKNIKSPKHIRIEILKKHPNSIIVGNIYKVIYSTLNQPEKSLEIKIKNDKKTEIVYFNLNQKSNEILFVKN